MLTEISSSPKISPTPLRNFGLRRHWHTKVNLPLLKLSFETIENKCGNRLSKIESFYQQTHKQTRQYRSQSSTDRIPTAQCTNELIALFSAEVRPRCSRTSWICTNSTSNSKSMHHTLSPFTITFISDFYRLCGSLHCLDTI